MDTSMNILEEAADITEGSRQRAYGHPSQNHSNTAALWTAYLNRKYGFEGTITARDVCLMMCLLKISRDANKENRDCLVDICGYARNAEMIDEVAAGPVNEWTSAAAFENSGSRSVTIQTIDGPRVVSLEASRLMDKIRAEQAAAEKGHDVYTTRPNPCSMGRTPIVPTSLGIHVTAKSGGCSSVRHGEERRRDHDAAYMFRTDMPERRISRDRRQPDDFDTGL